MGLGFLELKDPRAMLELIAVVKLGVVSGSIDPDEPVLFWPVRGLYLVIYLAETEPLKIVRILRSIQVFSFPSVRPALSRSS
jgi:hypothetical protein